MAESVTIHAFVRAPYDSYVHDETRFWNASGLSVKLGGTGVEVQLESLRALLLGGIAFDTPHAGNRAPQASLKTTSSRCSPTGTRRNAASYTRKIPVISYFPGSVRGLGPGSEVTMHGLVVGHVTERAAGLRPRPRTPSWRRFASRSSPNASSASGKRVFKTDAEAVDAVLKQGLRATLQSASLITGQQMVALDFVPDAPPATVTMEGDDFVLPTTEGGGFAGLAGLGQRICSTR